MVPGEFPVESGILMALSKEGDVGEDDDEDALVGSLKLLVPSSMRGIGSIEAFLGVPPFLESILRLEDLGWLLAVEDVSIGEVVDVIFFLFFAANLTLLDDLGLFRWPLPVVEEEQIVEEDVGGTTAGVGPVSLLMGG